MPKLVKADKSVKVKSLKGGTAKVTYYGTSADDVKVTVKDKTICSASISYDWWTDKITISIKPKKAGKTTVTLKDKKDGSKVSVKVTVASTAIFSEKNYSKIAYDDAYRYPDKYKGKLVQFSGKVLQVIDGTSTTTYRISSRGNYDNVVYVKITTADLAVPVLEDDKVTVYGSYAGNYTYESIFGQSIKIPYVEADKITITTKKK